MKLKTWLISAFKGPAERPFSKVALAPLVDLPLPPQPAPNPLLLRGLYRD
ncbi:MAG: hypothetical protein OEM59_16640 [Rhodospirillales bacterium]|nr:hypothetical protein [Rhodospirillales bacterium]